MILFSFYIDYSIEKEFIGDVLMKKCRKCGSENSADAEACEYCGATEFDESTEEPVSETTEETVPSDGGKAEKIIAACKKVNGERNYILNGAMAVIALILSLIVLLAPIKMSLAPLGSFAVPINEYTVITDVDDTGIKEEFEFYYTVDKNGKTLSTYKTKIASGITGRQMYVNQSIFDCLGALPYIFTDVKKDKEKISETTDDFETALTSVEKDFDKWLIEERLDDTDADYILKASKEKEKLVKKYFSELNIQKYMCAVGAVEMDSVKELQNELYKKLRTDTGSRTDAENAALEMQLLEANKMEYQIGSALTNVRVTVIFCLFIFGLSLAVAITSLVYLINAVISLCNKKPQKNLLKYLKTVFGLVAGVTIVTALTPLAKVGAGCIAATVVCSLALLLSGICRTFVVGEGSIRDKTVHSVKYSVIALIALITYSLLLSTNLFISVFQNNTVADSIKYPVGFLMSNCLNGIALMFAQIKNSGFVVGYNDGTLWSSIILLLLTTALICVTLTALYVTLAKTANIAAASTRRLFKKCSDITNASIFWFIIFAFVIVFCFLSKTIFIYNLTDGEKEFAEIVEQKEVITAFIKAAAQIWVTLALFVAVVICDNVIKSPTVYNEEPLFKKRKRKSPSAD